MFNLSIGFTIVIFSMMFENFFDPTVDVLFVAIGIGLIVKGAKQIIRDRKTDVNGIDTYGFILKTFTTGNSINNLPELKAEILTYLEDERTVKVFEEVVGYDSDKYNMGTYLRLKQFEDDINIVEVVTRDLIPDYILDELDIHIDKLLPKTTEIGGVKYVRADLIEAVDLNEKF